MYHITTFKKRFKQLENKIYNSRLTIVTPETLHLLQNQSFLDLNRIKFVNNTARKSKDISISIYFDVENTIITFGESSVILKHRILSFRHLIFTCEVTFYGKLDTLLCIDKCIFEKNVYFGKVLSDTYPPIILTLQVQERFYIKNTIFKRVLNCEHLEISLTLNSSFPTYYPLYTSINFSNCGFYFLVTIFYFQYADQAKIKMNNIYKNIVFENCLFLDILNIHTSLFEKEMLFMFCSFDSYLFLHDLDQTLENDLFRLDFLGSHFSSKVIKNTASIYFFKLAYQYFLEEENNILKYYFYSLGERSRNYESRKQSKTLISKILYWLSWSTIYGVFFNYGQSILRPFLIFLIIATMGSYMFSLLGGVEYLQLNIKSNKEEWVLVQGEYLKHIDIYFIASIKSVLKPFYTIDSVRIKGVTLLISLIFTIVEAVSVVLLSIALRRRFKA